MKIRLFFGLIFISKLAFAQIDKPLFLGNNYQQYVQQMDNYFATNDRGKGSGYKPFMRWREKYSSQIGADGKLQNFQILNIEAFNSANANFNKNAKTQATHGLWEDLGPHDYTGSDTFSNNALARLNVMAFHPTDINTIWVGAPNGGLWKTTNHGDTWACITNQFASIGIADIVVNSIDPNIIYILTGDGDAADSFSIGVMKTTDGGLNWKRTGMTFGVDQTIIPRSLRMHPTNSNILLASTNYGIFKTTNAGDTWVQTDTNLFAWDMEYKPGDPNVVYAVCGNGVLKSINGGDSFVFSNTGFPTDPMAITNPKTWGRLSIAISPSAPSNVYILCGGSAAAGTFSGMYKSTDSGASWVLKSNTPNILASDDSGGELKTQAGYDLALAVNPTNDAQLFVGGINCWKSDNQGVSWSRETNWKRVVGAVDPFVHADFHDVKFRGQRVYAANDGGIYYTDDYGHSWGDISSGIGVTQFYNIEIDDTSWIGGTQDNGCNEATFGNFQMHNIAGGDGFGAIWNASNHGIKYLSSQNVIYRRQAGSNIVINSGATGTGEFWYCTLKNDNSNPGILWGIQNKNTLIRGNQVCDICFATWDWFNTASNTLGVGEINGYSQGGDEPSVMYVAHEFNLLKTSNVYATPAPYTILPPPVASPALYYEDILVDPTDVQRVWAVCGGYTAGHKVFFSNNGGFNWTNISGSLPNIPIMSIALQPGGGDRIYIGTSIGVFYKQAGMADWVYYSNNLPNVTVSDIKLSSTHVYAGTFGRGIWRSELYTACPLNLTLTPANETNLNPFAPGKQEHSASQTLTSTRMYQGSVGTEIYLNGGQFVELKEGFELKKDAYLEVKNKGCPN